MNVFTTFTGWADGGISPTLTLALDWTKSYLVTGYITQTDTDSYGHIYISTVCSYNGGDQVQCGVRDSGDDFKLNITEIIQGASSITLKIHNGGGRHQFEGVVFEL